MIKNLYILTFKHVISLYRSREYFASKIICLIWALDFWIDILHWFNTVAPSVKPFIVNRSCLLPSVWSEPRLSRSPWPPRGGSRHTCCCWPWTPPQTPAEAPPHSSPTKQVKPQNSPYFSNSYHLQTSNTTKYNIYCVSNEDEKDNCYGCWWSTTTFIIYKMINTTKFTTLLKFITNKPVTPQNSPHLLCLKWGKIEDD